ncbi:hypothetical protein JZ751_003104 [Albula glossodonta]|uniref:Uncharacterized protein n=1 Tax=Albula glossodonta TaxID=121402 RepID=A0A8T2NA20_9TELE|nr:hypothetical protein JZ751_003104 [Albula glossodonta]
MLSLPSRPTSVWRLQGGMLWLESEAEGPAGSELEPSRSCREVGSVRSDSWLVEERRQGSRPVAEVRSEEAYPVSVAGRTGAELGQGFRPGTQSSAGSRSHPSHFRWHRTSPLRRADDEVADVANANGAPQDVAELCVGVADVTQRQEGGRVGQYGAAPGRVTLVGDHQVLLVEPHLDMWCEAVPSARRPSTHSP